MTEIKRNHAADRRANSLRLKPSRPQTNAFRHFQCVPRKTDIEIVEGERISAAIAQRNNKGRSRS